MLYYGSLTALIRLSYGSSGQASRRAVELEDELQTKAVREAELVEETTDVREKLAKVLTLLALLVHEYKYRHLRSSSLRSSPRHSVYSLYWYKSANTDT